VSSVLATPPSGALRIVEATATVAFALLGPLAAVRGAAIRPTG